MSVEQIEFLYWGIFVFLIGACIGSFLNVVIYRLPKKKSVISPRSQCRCGKAIVWYDNIPILSWFILMGKCRFCKESFSIRYPLIELFTAIFFFLLYWIYPLPEALVFMLYVALMIPAAMIDLDTMEIPDRFSIGGFLLGVLLSAIVPSIQGVDPAFSFVDGIRGIQNSLLGAFIGSGLILWIALVSEVVLKKETMGFGDVKLMGAIGAFCGWKAAVFSLFGGAFVGVIALAVCWPWLNKIQKNEETGLGLRIPFGPALVVGSFLYLFFFRDFVDAYFGEIQSVLNSF